MTPIPSHRSDRAAVRTCVADCARSPPVVVWSGAAPLRPPKTLRSYWRVGSVPKPGYKGGYSGAVFEKSLSCNALSPSRAVRRILHQRVLEGILCVGRRPAPEDQFGACELIEGLAQLLLRHSR